MSNQDSPIQKLPLPEWIQERIQNCHRIAASKSGSDRDDWLEDAKYFSEILRELAQAQERRRYIPGNLASEACNAAYNRACHTNKKAADELRPAFLGMLEAMLRVLADASAQPSIESFQDRVRPWLHECFGADVVNNRVERNHRLLEESLELVQACGCTREHALQIVEYVYGRPAGEPFQEVGGVMVTLAALCIANELSMDSAAKTELARIWQTIDHIRQKQAAKIKDSALPGSAQPSIESDALCTMLKEALCPMGRCAGGVTYLTGEEPRPCEWCERRAQLTKGPQATAQPSIESQAPLTIPDFLRNQDNLRAEKAETNATRSCNACEWTGPENETVHFKHWPDNLLCHECHETTELSTASPQSEPSP